ncbi:hypothetical protein TNCV_680951 [Trichonephila clavipes]|nr:hypothetical protein TNCV_680951 [Trichonephila clavipes]
MQKGMGSQDYLDFRPQPARQLVSSTSSLEQERKSISFLGNNKMAPNEVRLNKIVWLLPESEARVAAIAEDHRCYMPQH